jgi:hypothetical protein
MKLSGNKHKSMEKLILKFMITKPMVGVFQKFCSSPAGQEIPKFHHFVHEIQIFDHIKSQLNPAHTFAPYFF